MSTAPPSPGRAPLPRPPEEQQPVPLALLPPKKRWLRLWKQAEATIPDPQIQATPAGAGAINPRTSSSPAAVLKPSPSPSPLPPLAGDQKPRAPRPLARRLVPKGTTTSAAARKGNKVAEAAPVTVTAGALRRLQAVAEEEQEPGEVVPDDEKPPRQSLLGEETAAASVAGERVVEKRLVVSSKGEERDEVEMSGRQKRMREVFVGGLHWDAKEEDVRAALEEAGEITEVRMIMDARTITKNRGYCFVRYREAAQARKAIAELGNVKICGRQCRIEALEGNGKVKTAQKDPTEDCTSIYYGKKRPLSTLGDNFSYRMSRNPRARNGSNANATSTSSYGALPHAMVGYSPVYHHGSSMYLPADPNYYGLAEPWGRIPMRQSGSRKPGQPHGSRH